MTTADATPTHMDVRVYEHDTTLIPFQWTTAGAPILIADLPPMEAWLRVGTDEATELTTVVEEDPDGALTYLTVTFPDDIPERTPVVWDLRIPSTDRRVYSGSVRVQRDPIQ